MTEQAHPKDELTEDDVQVMQVHIEDTDAEFQGLAEIMVAPDPMENAATHDRRVLALSEGGDHFTTEGDPLRFYNKDADQVVAFEDRARALGYFLYGLETAADRILTEDGIEFVAEADAHDVLENIGVDLAPYHEMRDALTERDRQLRLLDYTEYRIDNGDIAAEPYLDDATWRSTNLSDSGRTLAERIYGSIDPKPRLCYHTAGTAAVKHAKNHRVAYVEGLTLPKHANQAIRHAWLEIDGEVAELTWPWHDVDGGDAVYFGVPIDTERVAEIRDQRGGGSPAYLDDATARAMDRAMRGEDYDE